MDIPGSEIKRKSRASEILEKEVGRPFTNILFGKYSPYEDINTKKARLMIEANIGIPGMIVDIGETAVRGATEPVVTAGLVYQSMQSEMDLVRTAATIPASLLFFRKLPTPRVPGPRAAAATARGYKTTIQYFGGIKNVVKNIVKDPFKEVKYIKATKKNKYS